MSMSIHINKAQKCLSPGRMSLPLSALMCLSALSICSSRCYTWVLGSPWNCKCRTLNSTFHSWELLRTHTVRNNSDYIMSPSLLPTLLPSNSIQITVVFQLQAVFSVTVLLSSLWPHYFLPSGFIHVTIFFSPICFQEEFWCNFESEN